MTSWAKPLRYSSLYKCRWKKYRFYGSSSLATWCFLTKNKIIRCIVYLSGCLVTTAPITDHTPTLARTHSLRLILEGEKTSFSGWNVQQSKCKAIKLNPIAFSQASSLSHSLCEFLEFPWGDFFVLFAKASWTATRKNANSIEPMNDQMSTKRPSKRKKKLLNLNRSIKKMNNKSNVTSPLPNFAFQSLIKFVSGNFRLPNDQKKLWLLLKWFPIPFFLALAFMEVGTLNVDHLIDIFTTSILSNATKTTLTHTMSSK